MHLRTEATLAELRRAAWFERLGVEDTLAAVVLTSWDEAMRHCQSSDWIELRQEAVGQYHLRLEERSPERRQKWNELVDEIKPLTQALVTEKTARIIELKCLPREFRGAVDWDVLHACMEAEYADVFPPGFYAGQAYWYVKGHFPCGWEGAFPSGKPVIY